jgi:outer membrane protein assembly factor BamB
LPLRLPVPGRVPPVPRTRSWEGAPLSDRFRIVAALLLALPAAACSAGAGSSDPLSTTAIDSPTDEGELAPVVTVELGGGEAAGALAFADGALWVTHFEGTSVSRVDLDTGEEVATVEVGPRPGGMEAVGDELWIEHFTRSPSITAIDPSDGTVLREIEMARPCCDIALVDGDVWTLGPEAGLQRIDARTGEVVATVDIPISTQVNANMVSTDEALWLASQGDPLIRVEAGTAKVDGRFDVGRMLPYAVGPDGLIWCAGLEGVAAVDPRTGKLAEDFDPVDMSEVISMAVDDRSVWLGIRDGAGDGQLLQLDRGSGAEVGRTAISLPLRMIELDGTLWVSDYLENRLLGFSA